MQTQGRRSEQNAKRKKHAESTPYASYFTVGKSLRCIDDARQQGTRDAELRLHIQTLTPDEILLRSTSRQNHHNIPRPSCIATIIAMNASGRSQTELLSRRRVFKRAHMAPSATQVPPLACIWVFHHYSRPYKGTFCLEWPTRGAASLVRPHVHVLHSQYFYVLLSEIFEARRYIHEVRIEQRAPVKRPADGTLVEYSSEQGWCSMGSFLRVFAGRFKACSSDTDKNEAAAF